MSVSGFGLFNSKYSRENNVWMIVIVDQTIWCGCWAREQWRLRRWRRRWVLWLWWNFWKFTHACNDKVRQRHSQTSFAHAAVYSSSDQQNDGKVVCAPSSSSECFWRWPNDAFRNYFCVHTYSLNYLGALQRKFRQSRFVLEQNGIFSTMFFRIHHNKSIHICLVPDLKHECHVLHKFEMQPPDVAPTYAQRMPTAACLRRISSVSASFVSEQIPANSIKYSNAQRQLVCWHLRGVCSSERATRARWIV